MPHYFINIRSHFDTKEDLDGFELPDIAAANAEALKIGQRLLQSLNGLEPCYCSAIVIEITDEDLNLVLAIPYADITDRTRVITDADAGGTSANGLMTAAVTP